MMTLDRSLICWLFLCLVFTPAFAGPDVWKDLREEEREVMRYLERKAREITERARGELESIEKWESLRERRTLEMRDMLGLLPWPERTPLKVRITGRLDRGDHLIEKLAFEALPGFYVTANLYLPKQGDAPHPAVVYVCGHAGSEFGSKVAYQRHGISLAKNGYVAIVLDTIQLSEIFALHHGVFAFSMYDWYARGYTPAGVEVWNAVRAIDYLETRPEVDASRIGMTGRSGGAAISWFTAAVDPRVRVVVPVMGISTYAANLLHNTQQGHCDCMFPINSWEHDMIHQGALIAPRPLLMAHGIQDALFPVDGYREFEEVLSGLYGAYGEPEAFRNIEVDTGHQDSDFLREQAIRWFDRFLKGVEDRPLDLEYTNLSAAELSVFGGRPPADTVNHRIHLDFIPAPDTSLPAGRAEWERRREELLGTLREKVFPRFPERIPAPATVRREEQSGPFEALEFQSEEGIRLRARLRRPADAEGTLPGILYIASEGETEREIERFFREVNSRGAAVRLVVYPRLVDEVPINESVRKDVNRNAMHVGRTLDSMRLWDALGGLQVLRAESGVDSERILVAGRGAAGILGVYAALLDPGVDQILLIEPNAGHAQGPIFLNVLRHTDVAEVAGLLAPRRLSFFNHIPPQFEKTRAIFRLIGVEERIGATVRVEELVTD